MAKEATKPVSLATPQAASSSTAAVLAKISEYQGKAELTAASSRVAKRLNKDKEHPCPTGGRSHPARPAFFYWTGADVESFIKKNQG